jgi:flagellar M-ring protein FliF
LPPGATPTVAQGATAPAGAATPGNAAGTEVTGPDSKSRQSTRNYEIDRTMAYTRTPAGRVTRLSVAVLIDNLRTTAADGKVTETPLPPEQIERLTALVRDAVGFDAARGDTVNVVNSSFAGIAAIPEGELETIPFWEKAWVQDLAKLLGGVLVLFVIIFSVLKPLTKGLLTQARHQPQLLSAVGGSGNLIAGGGGGEGQSLAYEQQVAQARGLVSQDPKRVAQVVKTWVSTDG